LFSNLLPTDCHCSAFRKPIEHANDKLVPDEQLCCSLVLVRRMLVALLVLASLALPGAPAAEDGLTEATSHAAVCVPGLSLACCGCCCITVLLLFGGSVLQWYVDVVLALLERAGDFCSDDIWQRVVQLITNNEGSQVYAAGQVVEVLHRGAGHEALMCMAAYVLGEYGRLVQVGHHLSAGTCPYLP
jgi:hypothetical protein